MAPVGLETINPIGHHPPTDYASAVVSERPACAVTGASGYVGRIVAARLEADGYPVRPFVRSATGADREFVRFSLQDDVAPDAFHGVHALVHAAWDLDARTWTEIESVNVTGSCRLFDAAHAAGVHRLVFVSSLAAYPDCRSMYGRAKLAVEGHVRRLGGVVVRPGLVWGPRGGSLYVSLARLARALPLLPVFTGERVKLYLAHEEDVARFIARLVSDEHVPEQPLAAAAAEGFSMAEILRRVAAVNGRRPQIVHVPWQAVWAGLRGLELLGLNPPFRSDSVVSLVGSNQDPFAETPPPPGFRAYQP